jgi:putative spermidine/putrescine transport system ATP-binding protein
VAQFIGENNTLEGVVQRLDDERCVVRLDSGDEIDAKPVNVRRGGRAHQRVDPARAGGGQQGPLRPDAHRLKARVEEFIYMGDMFRTRLTVAGNATSSSRAATPLTRSA